MGYCINCLFQGDNSLDENGEGRVFCMVKRKWVLEGDSCIDFTEYADLSKEIRCKYAMEVRENKESSGSKFSDIIKQTWKFMLFTLILSFMMFIAAAKFFDKYIF